MDSPLAAPDHGFALPTRSRKKTTALPLNSRVAPQEGQATAKRRVSRKQLKPRTAGLSTSPPSPVIRPRPPPFVAERARWRRRRQSGSAGSYRAIRWNVL